MVVSKVERCCSILQQEEYSSVIIPGESKDWHIVLSCNRKSTAPWLFQGRVKTGMLFYLATGRVQLRNYSWGEWRLACCSTLQKEQYSSVIITGDSEDWQVVLSCDSNSTALSSYPGIVIHYWRSLACHSIFWQVLTCYTAPWLSQRKLA